MQVRLLPGLALFVGSYFPLGLILLLQDVKEEYWHRTFCVPMTSTACSLPQLSNPGRTIVFAFVCLVSLIAFLWLLRRLPAKTEMTVVDAKAVPNDLINYVFPYVVSFMGLDVGSSGRFYGLLFFMFWMFLITYRSGQILMNPLLLVAGWQLFELNVTMEGHPRCVKALSRDRIVAGDRLVTCVVQGIHVLHRGSESDHTRRL